MNLLDLYIEAKDETHRVGLLSSKYTPKRLCDWMENKDSIDAILTWFSSNSQILIVNGKSSSGKSSVVDLICKEMSIKPCYALLDQPRTITAIRKRFNEIKNLPGVFIIDEFELYFNNNVDNIKNFVTELSNTVGLKRRIIIIDSFFLPKLKQVTKGITTVQFHRPSPESVYSKCGEVIRDENIRFDTMKDGPDLKNYIINNKCNVRYIINALQMYKCIEPISSIEETGLNDVYKICIDTDVPLNIRLKYFELDAGTIPIICHENYIDFDLKHHEYLNISESMSLGDVYHKKTFSNQTDVNIHTYCCLSTLSIGKYIKNSNDVKTPRFGLIWTKQAARYQKKRYIDTFYTIMNYAPKDMYSNFIDHLYVSESIESPKIWKNVVDSFQTTNGSILYNLYNAFIREKTVTKKSFISKCNKLQVR
jgi:hypothetical protein